MNILFVSEIYLPTVSGVASSTDSITRFMAKRGHTVYLVVPRPMVSYIPEKQTGLHIIFAPRLRDLMYKDKPMTIFPLGFYEIWSVFKNHHIDVVHIQEPGALGIAALILSKMYKIPVVGAMHFSMEQILRMASPLVRPLSVPAMTLYIRLVYPRYTAIMMPTVTVTKDLARLIGHPERIHAVSNGIETNIYTPRNGSTGALRKKYTLDSNATYYIYIGRLDPDKNIETILRALAKTPQAIRLIIAGLGAEKVALKELAVSLRITDRITWFDKIPMGQIIELYQLSDAFIITSPVETQSIVTLQAIACGLPVIAAKAGALPELVHDGENGYLVPTYDVQVISQKMEYLATHPAIREAMGKKSRTISLAHEKSRVLLKLEHLYREVVASYAPARSLHVAAQTESG